MNSETIHLKLVKSGFDTVKDDYTAIVVANGSVDKAGVCAKAAEVQPHLDADIALQTFDQEWLLIFANLAEGRHVTNDGIGYDLYVEGSYLNVDDEINAEDISIAVTLYDEKYANAFAGVKVTTSVDESALPFKFDRVQNGTEFGKLTQGATGKTMGYNQSTGLPGEKIEIVDSAGSLFTIEDAVAGREGLTLSFTTPAEAQLGKASVTVYSRGLLTPEGDVTKLTHTCTIVAGAVDPKPVGPKPRVMSIKDSSGVESGANTVQMNYDLIFMGQNLGDVTKVHFDYKREDGSTAAHDVTGSLITASDNQLTLNEAFWMEMGDAKRDSELTATLSTDAGLSHAWPFNIV